MAFAEWAAPMGSPLRVELSVITFPSVCETFRYKSHQLSRVVERVEASDHAACAMAEHENGQARFSRF
jgi:hypothetical protein